MLPLDFRNYPDEIDDKAGYDYKDGEYYAAPINKDRREIRLEITSFRNYSYGAIHYYGELLADGICRTKDNETLEYIFDDNPLHASEYRFELRRIITQKEIDSDKDRWLNYQEGDAVNAFNSKKELIDLALECVKSRFIGNWSFVVNDNTAGKTIEYGIVY
jgi:hypothetical protein